MSERLREPMFFLALFLALAFMWLFAWQNSVLSRNADYLPPAKMPAGYVAALNGAGGE